MPNFDVIILGSGISGCAAAIMLFEKGYKVAVASPNIETQHHLPESWMVNYPGFIRRHGLEEELAGSFYSGSECAFYSHDGKKEVKVSVNSGENNFSEGDLVLINRDAFDHALKEKAADLGVGFIRFQKILRLSMDGEVFLELDAGEEKINCRAPFMIDASGKSGYLTQALNLKSEARELDRRRACFSHFVLEGGNCGGMKIISIENGHIFCIPTHSGRASIGCVIEEGLEETAPEQIFAAGLEQSPYL